MTTLLVPVIEGVTESVAVTVCGPAVLKTTLKVPTPFVSDTPWPLTEKKLGSVLVKFTVPLYPGNVAPFWSRHVTVTGS